MRASTNCLRLTPRISLKMSQATFLGKSACCVGRRHAARIWVVRAHGFNFFKGFFFGIFSANRSPKGLFQEKSPTSLLRRSKPRTSCRRTPRRRIMAQKPPKMAQKPPKKWHDRPPGVKNRALYGFFGPGGLNFIRGKNALFWPFFSLRVDVGDFWSKISKNLKFLTKIKKLKIS